LRCCSSQPFRRRGYRLPDFKVYEFSQLVCVARQVGDYRVQILIEPTEPKAGERFWVTAVISELDGRPASVTHISSSQTV